MAEDDSSQMGQPAKGMDPLGGISVGGDSGSAGGQSPRPFDASLFDQGESDKPTSPSFPAESPFMITPDDTPAGNVEQPSSQVDDDDREPLQKPQSLLDTDDALKGSKPPSVAQFFKDSQSQAKGGASFFDSFTSVGTDDTSLFATPPTSLGATPVLSPEGPGFNDYQDPLGITSDTSINTLEAEGINSETLSMDSTNLLADGDDQKDTLGVNADTVSMDSTNLLDDDREEQSTTQTEENTDGNQVGDLVQGKDESVEVELGKDILTPTVNVENPETAATDKSDKQMSSDVVTEVKVTVEDPLNVQSSEPIHKDTKEDALEMGPAGGGAPDVASRVGDKMSGGATHPLTSVPQDTKPAAPQSSSPTESPWNTPEKTLSAPPPLMSSFSAPSGLVNPSPGQTRTPFQSSASQEGDDPFVAALRSSEIDRRHDAWLPSEATQKILAGRSIALQGSEYVNREQLTMPGIIAEEPQGDPIKDLVYRYMGEQECAKRSVLTVNQVTRDETGLKRLLDAGCLRAAIDLSGLLLTAGGQGKGQSGLPSRHTPHLMKVWFTRISLFMKLQQFTAAEQEMEAFGGMDKPDLFFEYYPDLYPGRKGSIVPFSFRIIHSELPMYLGKHQLCLDRLSVILSVCTRIIKNLEDGNSEYGHPIELSDDNRKAAIDLWKSREVRVLHSVGNCLVGMKEYLQAVNIFKSLLEKEPDNKENILSGIARVYLQLGDLKSAQEVYSDVEKTLSGKKDGQARIHINKGFLKVAQNQYSEAYKNFNEALKIEPNNFMAINNISVCLLYLGRLKEALALLENLLNKDTSLYLDESILFNLCTLYELESSKSTSKKQHLLSLVSKHKGDGFNVSCLKML